MTNKLKSFKLLPQFTGKSFNLSDSQLFNEPKKTKCEVTLPVVENENIHFELRAFIQKNVIEDKLSPWKAQSVTANLCLIEDLLNSEKYLHLQSISDIDFPEFIHDLEVFTNVEPSKPNSKRSLSFYTAVDWYCWVGVQVKEDSSFYFDNDIWILKYSPIPIENSSHVRNAFYFNTFSVEWVKNAAKHLILYCLKNLSANSCQLYINNARYFDAFVYEYGYTGPEEITREIIENRFLPYAHKKYPDSQSCNIFIRAVERLFIVANLDGVEGFNSDLFLKDDYLPKRKPDPKPFSDRELALILQHIHELKEIDFDIVSMQILQGFRITDIARAKIRTPDGSYALQKEEDDSWCFTFYQYKTRRWTTTILQTQAGDILNSRIQKSIEKYGEHCQYIFATDEDRCVNQDDYRKNLKKMVKRNNLRGDDGELIPIGNTHRFRKTVATDLINLIHDPEPVAAVLGQKGLGSLAHYIKITATETMEAMRNIHQETDTIIRHLGKDDCPNILENSAIPDFDSEETLIPLSNGFCCKPGSEICEHADSCLFCAMFKPDRSYIPVYRFHICQAKVALESAKLQGFDTIVEHNEQIIKQLEKIIKKLEDYNDE